MLRAQHHLRLLARRALHSDAFSVPAASWPAGVRGIDMSGLPGYQVAADEAPPPCANSRLAEFALRHGRLERDHIANGKGYLWVGPVAYPTGLAQYALTWDIADADPPPAPAPAKRPTPVYAKRRYTGGQARRIRQQRQDSLLRRARRKAPAKPSRKPKNDLPKDDS